MQHSLHVGGWYIVFQHGGERYIAPVRVDADVLRTLEALAYRLANCKLAPEPDAALHNILVQLLTAAQALKADPGNLKPVADIRAAIAHYPQYFTDPGWDKLAPDKHSVPDES